MIRIKVTSYRGQASSESIGFDFDESGGTIGRRDSNQLVLRDPTQQISREQARVLFRNGGFELIDRGMSPTLVNGRPLGKDQSIALRPGDELQIGDYSLVVEDPTRQGKAPSFLAPAATSEPTRVIDDPLGLFGNGVAPTTASSNPFADLLGAAGSAPPAAPAAETRPTGWSVASGAPAPAARRAGNVIPDDFDPFADPFARRPEPAPEPGATLPDGLDLGPIGQPRAQGGGSLDPLFDLGAGVATDPFAGSPLGDSLSSPDTAADHGVLASLGAVHPRHAAPVPDRVPEIHAPFPAKQRGSGSAAPASSRDAGIAQSHSVPGSAEEALPEADAAASTDVFLSWQSESLLGPSGISSATLKSSASVPYERRARPRVSRPGSPNDPAQANRPMAASDAEARRQVKGVAEHSTAPAVSPSHEPAAPPAAATDEALLQALRAGLGLPNLPLAQGLNVELMERMGHLLREATQGTLDLLLARAATKREVRAELTVISTRDNNPLKFSPNVAVALAHLMSPPQRGFLPPREAMRDAYEDLRVHQFGFMAGLRAALADVLGRFDPQVLEKRLTQKTMLDSLLPMNRRAKLWDLYNALYGDIAAEAEDDFHTLFGREFLRAYQEQVARLGSGKERS